MFGSLSLLWLLLSLSVQIPPSIPQVSFDNFGPGIREHAKSAYQAAIRNPKDALAAGRLGMVLHTYEDHENAAACYRRARILAPGEFRWTYFLGVSQMALGKHREAALILQEALELNPDYLPARLKLADSLLAAGELEKSRQHYQLIINKQAEFAQAHYGLGRVSAAEQKFSTAVEHFLKAINLFPNYGAAHYALAMAYRDTDNKPKAVEHLALSQKFKSINPLAADPLLIEVADLNSGATERIRRGQRLEAEGRLKESITEHERALEINPQLVQAHINLIQLFGRTGNPDQAERHYRAAVSLNPNIAESHYNFGVMLLEQKRMDDASIAFRRSIEINPYFSEAHLNLGTILERQQLYDEALWHYRAAVSNKPNFRIAHFQLARMLIFKDQLLEAIKHLHQTLTPEDENTPRFTYALAAAYVRAGEKESALLYARQAREHAKKLNQTELLALIERDLLLLEKK
ncbi:MAG: tetratricopeptide repeat protein [Acidobacteria bacterium]|nr:tetratricopeptide repeat protein [Acidobacteriota bacterium]